MALGSVVALLAVYAYAGSASRGHPLGKLLRAPVSKSDDEEAEVKETPAEPSAVSTEQCLSTGSAIVGDAAEVDADAQLFRPSAEPSRERSICRELEDAAALAAEALALLETAGGANRKPSPWRGGGRFGGNGHGSVTDGVSVDCAGEILVERALLGAILDTKSEKFLRVRKQVWKLESLLRGVRNEAAGSWHLGRSKMLAQLRLQLNSLRPSQDKLLTWALAVRRRAALQEQEVELGGGASEGSLRWSEFAGILPLLGSEIRSCLGTEPPPAVRLIQDEAARKAFTSAVESLAGDPWDDADEQDGYHAMKWEAFAKG